MSRTLVSFFNQKLLIFRFKKKENLEGPNEQFKNYLCPIKFSKAPLFNYINCVLCNFKCLMSAYLDMILISLLMH